jgi:signal transduction histidine kinase
MLTATRPPSDPAPAPPRLQHPLEIIPFFQRFPPGRLRNLLYTFLWGALFAVFFTALSLLYLPPARLLRTFGVCMLISTSIAYLMHAVFHVGQRLLRGWPSTASRGARSAYYAIVSVAGVFGGYWIAFTLLQWHDDADSLFSLSGATTVVVVSLFVSGVLVLVFGARERRARAEAAFQAERARVEAVERQFQLARFKLLEAQVEPHFLYNTLANVISLIDQEPATAKRMVERLIDYLRGAAVAAGSGDATLGGQLAMLRAYLDLIVLRMGSRLRYRIDVPPELALLPLPPMLLQPLVENAIKHGLEPKVAGGEVVVSAARVGGDVALVVADDGLGVQPTSRAGSTGIGLANLRQRLATMYGAGAHLIIEDAQPGTRVTVTLPAPGTP